MREGISMCGSVLLVLACISGSPRSALSQSTSAAPVHRAVADSVARCAAHHQELGSAIVGIQMSGDPTTFVPAIAPTARGGQCGSVPTAPGLSTRALFFPDSAAPVREVTLVFDSTGRAISYSDVRGDQSPERVTPGPDGAPRITEPPGLRTDIFIDLAHRAGMAKNSGGGKPPTTILLHGKAMMRLGNLDDPAHLIAMVKSRCGTPAAASR